MLNHRAILDSLDGELARARREQGCLTVAMADLDGFKPINDTHGHLAGDAVLKEVVLRIRDLMRPYDQIGRYGGDEFLILLPGCSLDDAAGAVDRLCDGVSSKPIDTPDGVVSVTVSIGLASSSAPDLGDAHSLIAAADAALYHAKARRRSPSPAKERTT